MNMYDRLIILIPTFNPTDKLIKTINILKESGFKHIIIVNDGSLENEIFSKIDVYRVLKHDVNMGKGQALKTGFKYISKLDFDGVITLDDDLQQDILDIKKIADYFLKKEGIYFGVRTFENAPFIRKMANKMTSKIFKMKYHEDIGDTQTGLRCFPKSLLSSLLEVDGSGFEYEMNVLKFLVKEKYNINKVHIKTIYNDNKSHYHAIKDSYKIFKAIFK